MRTKFCPICGIENNGSWCWCCWKCWYKFKDFVREKYNNDYCHDDVWSTHSKEYLAKIMKEHKEKVEFT